MKFHLQKRKTLVVCNFVNQEGKFSLYNSFAQFLDEHRDIKFFRNYIDSLTQHHQLKITIDVFENYKTVITFG